MDAIILAGGFGSRLRGILPEGVPKPLAMVGGVPFLMYVFSYLKQQGICRVILSLGYGAEAIIDYVKKLPAFGLKIDYVVETVPLGTGGGAALAAQRTNSANVLLLNGDSFLRFSLRELLDVSFRTGANAVMSLVHVSDSARFGTVVVDKDGVVTEFLEKKGESASGLINAGVYLLNSSTLSNLPSAEFFSLEHDILPPLVNNGLRGVIFEPPFIDIGTPDSLSEAQTFFGQIGLRNDY